MALGESFLSVLTAAQEGGEWAWRVLYQELAPQVHGYLRTRGAHDPDDLLGEVFLQLARNVDRFSGGEASFRSWVFMIAHNRLIDERRIRGRRAEDLVPPQELGSQPGAGDVVADVLQRLSSERVTELLRMLTSDQQEVMALRILGGFTLAEVARILGKRVGAVKALQHRAVAALRRALEEEEAATF